MESNRIEKLAESMSYCLKCEKKDGCCKEYCYSENCVCNERLLHKAEQED
jgi:hypothetical protein